jgi:hypothetical protein
MIDLAYDYNKPQREVCECGEPECLGDAKWFAEATADIALQLAEQVPGLDSPLLRLVKERNEAREMVKKLLYTAHLGDASQEKYDALAEAHKAVFAWKGGAQ